MRFEDAYEGWTSMRLTQIDAARLLGVCPLGRLGGHRDRRQGLFCSLYTDRGSHYWHTPEAGGKLDKTNPTPFGRAMAQLGIERLKPLRGWWVEKRYCPCSRPERPITRRAWPRSHRRTTGRICTLPGPWRPPQTPTARPNSKRSCSVKNNRLRWPV